jgi:hypothetical protein
VNRTKVWRRHRHFLNKFLCTLKHFLLDSVLGHLKSLPPIHCFVAGFK